MGGRKAKQQTKRDQRKDEKWQNLMLKLSDPKSSLVVMEKEKFFTFVLTFACRLLSPHAEN
jgi:hypothetical protein